MATLNRTADKQAFIDSQAQKRAELKSNPLKPETAQKETEVAVDWTWLNRANQPVVETAQPRFARTTSPPSPQERTARLYLWHQGPQPWRPEIYLPRDESPTSDAGVFKAQFFPSDRVPFTIPESDIVTPPTAHEAWQVSYGILEGRFANAIIRNAEDFGQVDKDLPAISLDPYEMHDTPRRYGALLYLPAPLERYDYPRNEYESTAESKGWTGWHNFKQLGFDYSVMYTLSMKPREMPTFYFFLRRDVPDPARQATDLPADEADDYDDGPESSEPELVVNTGTILQLVREEREALEQSGSTELAELYAAYEQGSAPLPDYEENLAEVPISTAIDTGHQGVQASALSPLVENIRSSRYADGLHDVSDSDNQIVLVGSSSSSSEVSAHYSLIEPDFSQDAGSRGLKRSLEDDHDGEKDAFDKSNIDTVPESPVNQFGAVDAVASIEDEEDHILPVPANSPARTVASLRYPGSERRERESAPPPTPLPSVRDASAEVLRLRGEFIPVEDRAEVANSTQGHLHGHPHPAARAATAPASVAHDAKTDTPSEAAAAAATATTASADVHIHEAVSGTESPSRMTDHVAPTRELPASHGMGPDAPAETVPPSRSSGRTAAAAHPRASRPRERQRAEVGGTTKIRSGRVSKAPQRYA